MKSLIVAVLVAAFAFTLSAQEKKAPGEHSMTGCLQKGSAPNSYMLDNVEGNVEVTGVAVPATEAETDKSVPKAPHYMKLSGIKMVSTTCP